MNTYSKHFESLINGDGTLLSKNNLLFSIFFLTKFKVQIYTIYQKTK